MHCPNCGTESNISTGFCACCGSPLPENGSADVNQPKISPVLPGENFFPGINDDPSAGTVEKLTVDTSAEEAAAREKHKRKVIIISVVCSVLAVIAIITGIVLAVRKPSDGEDNNPLIKHSYDSYYETVQGYQDSGKYYISAEMSVPGGSRTQLRYAADGEDVSVFGVFEKYNVIISKGTVYIFSADGNEAALVPENMLSLCKGFTKEGCKLNTAYFGIEKPATEPINTLDTTAGKSCTFTCSDTLKADGIFTSTSVYDRDGRLLSTEYFDEKGTSVKSYKYNEVSGAFDTVKLFTPDPSVKLYTETNEVRKFLATIFDEELQGDINIAQVGLTCTVPSGWFAVFNGVTQEDAIRCGFDINTAEVVKAFPSDTFMSVTDGSSDSVAKLFVYSSSSPDYSDVSSMADINSSLMDYYSTTCDEITCSRENPVYNQISYAVMEVRMRDGKNALIYDTVEGGLHYKFYFYHAQSEISEESKKQINDFMKSVKINTSSLTEKPASEYPSYTADIRDYGVSCTVPSGWFAVSADTTQSEAAALGFSSLSVDSLKSLLQPDGGIFTVLSSLHSKDKIYLEFYAADEADRNTLDSSVELPFAKAEVEETYKDLYGNAVVEETKEYNGVVYFVVNTGNKLIYDTVYGGYYYIFSFDTASVTDSVKYTMKNFISTLSINTSLVSAVPSVIFPSASAEAYSYKIGGTGLTATVPAGWLGIDSSTKQSEAIARGFENINTSSYTSRINQSERIESFIVCAASETIPEDSEIVISASSYNAVDFNSMSEDTFKSAVQTFTEFNRSEYTSAEYYGTESYNGLKYIIISANRSGKGVRIYETVYNSVNYTISMDGSSGSLSPTELSVLQGFVKSIKP